ncbi:hypothetical protein ACFXD5_19485 [Streptomyces sp. NPDC059385]|uniref:hypothetical protein n=1 Tax=Streptomyces sp. NPDC059385 TaxID=3346817 RepID=UPI0036935DF2
MHEPMSPQRETIVRREMADTTYAKTWHIRENETGERMVWEITHEGTVLATLPDWAGSLALWIADARDDVPQLLAEVDRLRMRVAELEGAAVCPSVARVYGSRCVLPVRHRGDHRNADSWHYWDDSHAVPNTAKVGAPDGH